MPDKILNRRRKAYVSRAPLKALASQWPSVFPSSKQSLLGALLILDLERFSDILKRISCGEDVGYSPTDSYFSARELPQTYRTLHLGATVSLNSPEDPR